MRITSLWVKRPLLNRISYWLYKRYCNEPYVPEGKVSVMVRKKGDTPASKESMVRITFEPKPFVPGIHEWYIFDSLSEGITFWSDLFKE